MSQALHTLENLTAQAKALAGGQVPLTDNETEVARQLQICNACRYCEGFCAVFPAMTRRLEFGKADIHYLANLCHNCGACLHACQYAPPHEFAVNVPQSMAKVRMKTYTDYAWPPSLGKLYQHNGLLLSMALTLGISLFLILALALRGSIPQNGAAGFYQIFPHNLMVGLFAPVFVFAATALGTGVRQFWQNITPATSGAPLSSAATAEATHDVLRLRYLDGGHGDGCNNANDAFTHSRRRAHHWVFYGFLLCFAATSVATLDHYLWGTPAPYDLPSLPKLLGVGGGVAMLIGTVALFALNLRRNPQHGDVAQKPMDLGFLALLFTISATGLLLWQARSSVLMPTLLAAHLGAVMALFATAPYSKFAHSIFRTAALLRYAVEKRQPNTLGLGGD